MKTKLKINLIVSLFVFATVLNCLSIAFIFRKANAQTEKMNNLGQMRCATALDVVSRFIDEEDNCLNYDYRDDHGRGREQGGERVLNVGCRNYKSYDFKYGTTNIPYWINLDSFNSIINSIHRQEMINMIRVQAELWNQTFMYDGTDYFINFYELASKDKPKDIKGKPVIEIQAYNFGNNNIFGQFVRNEYTVRLGYDFKYNQMNSSLQFVAHELGHVLGLGDLDSNYSDHAVLMGYGLSIITENLSEMIQYQDIQGAAVINKRHTCSQSHFMRYKAMYNSYYHICFYCDRLEIRTDVIQGSKKIQNICIESEHEYKPMVSCGNMRWDKCTKCYNVKKINIQSDSAKNVFLYKPGANVENSSITAATGKVMPEVDSFALQKSGYSFDGYCDVSGKKYYEMEVVNDPVTASLNSVPYYYREKLCTISGTIWDHRNKVTLYPIWKPLEVHYTYQNVANGELISSSTVDLVHGRNYISPIIISNYKFLYFTYRGKQYSSVPAEIVISLKRNYGKKDSIITDDVLVAYYEEDSCLAAGSMITLADGSLKAVENLTGDEMLLVWNLYTGTYDSAPILFIDSDPEKFYKVINLSFSDGTTVKVISEHGFWDCDLNKYVYLDENAGKYIGHWFNKGEQKVKLVGVEIREEYTTAWSPVTYSHLCYYVNGMLSMPGGIEGLFNIFEVDHETMKYDEAAMQADIEKYGMFEYEEFSQFLALSEDAFGAYNGKYLKIAIGKGLTTFEELAALYERYGKFFA